jgi:GNAT superfamily N-acetyltransferase
MPSIRFADSDDEIAGCFSVMRQLRTHLPEEDFVSRVRRQEAGGYRIAFLEDDGIVRAVAGFRYYDNLHSGRVLYVDDLVTDATARSKGYGKQILDWLVAQARDAGCQTFELDSGVQRFDAHRFYLANRMIISSHHFKLAL